MTAMDPLIAFLGERHDEREEQYKDAPDVYSWELADLASKRLIVDTFTTNVDPNVYTFATPTSAVGETVVRLLALPYIEHPEYRDEWQPESGPRPSLPNRGSMARNPSHAAMIAFIDARLDEEWAVLAKQIQTGAATRADLTEISDLRPSERDRLRRERPSSFLHILAARWSGHPDYQSRWGQ